MINKKNRKKKKGIFFGNFENFFHVKFVIFKIITKLNNINYVYRVQFTRFHHAF